MKQSGSLSFLKKHFPLILLAGIILLAAFFRFYQIASLPPALHPNEALFGNQALMLLTQNKLSLGGDLGTTGVLFIGLQALALWVLKVSEWSLRIVPAFFGTLAVLTTFLLAKEWFGRRVALIASGIMAISPWAVMMSRNGLSASLMPFFVTLGLWLATKAYRSGKMRYYVLTSIAFALGCYGYIAFILILLPLIAVTLLLSAFRRTRLPHIKQFAVATILFLLLIAPAIVVGVANRATLAKNISSVSVLSSSNSSDRMKLVANNTLDTILMFNLKGDENYRHNLGGLPLLSTFIGIMFILGILVVASRPKRLSHIVLLSSFVTLLLPAILAAGNVPNALRSAGTIPLVMILSGIGVNYLLSRWYATFPVNGVARSIGLALVMMLLCLSAYQGYKQYFVAWAQDPKTYVSYDEPLTQMAKFVNAESQARGLSGDNTYILVDGYADQTIHFLTYKKTEYTPIDDGGLRGLPLNKQPKLFIVAQDSVSRDKLDLIATKYPGGRVVSHYSPFNQEKLFYSYELNK